MLEYFRRLMTSRLRVFIVAFVVLTYTCNLCSCMRGALYRSGRAVVAHPRQAHFIHPQGYQEFMRFGRSLYDVDEDSHQQVRSQRRLTPQEQTLDVDADDGQMLRFGRSYQH
uniref:Uncharacterized protein n=1 Tax=Ditylenchus dipsaci TaxID=166011 RepID=A0A915EHL4_9BILA